MRDALSTSSTNETLQPAWRDSVCGQARHVDAGRDRVLGEPLHFSTKEVDVNAVHQEEGVTIAGGRYSEVGPILETPPADAEKEQETSPRRLRLLAEIRSWAGDKAAHYGWTTWMEGKLTALSNCARIYPAFEDFIVAANYVLFDRHRRSIHEEPSQAIHPIGSHEPQNQEAHPWQPLTSVDLLRIRKHRPDGFDARISTEIQKWVEDANGDVKVLDAPLRSWCLPHTLSKTFISYDEHGMLVPRAYGQNSRKKRRSSEAPQDDANGSSLVDRAKRPRLHPMALRTTSSSSVGKALVPTSNASRTTRRVASNLPAQDTGSSPDNVTKSTSAEALRQIIAAWSLSTCESASTFVRYISHVDFMQLVNTPGRLLQQVFVVEDEPFSDAGLHSVDNYLKDIYLRHTGKMVDVRTTPCDTHMCPIEDLINDLKRNRSTSSKKFPRNNLLNLRNWSTAQAPAFTQVSRFRLLEFLTDRDESVSKKIVARPCDVAGCIRFDILGFVRDPSDRAKCAFSGAHIDLLNGTWVRILYGSKDWFIVHEEAMTAEDWKAFETNAWRWKPGNKAVRIRLKKGDVIVMPPGLLVIHAVSSTDTHCLATGGMFWDSFNLAATLKNILYTFSKHLVSNEGVVLQMPRLLRHLEDLLLESPEYFAVNGALHDISDIQSLIRSFPSRLGCTCKSQGGPCSAKAGCRCLREHRRCTEWCENHKDFGTLSELCFQL